MTYGAFTSDDFPSFEVRGRSRAAVPQQAVCALALVASTSIGLWALYGHSNIAPASLTPPPTVASTTIEMPFVPPALAPATPKAADGFPMTGLRRDASLLRQTLTVSDPTIISAQNAPLRSTLEPLIAPAQKTIAPISIPDHVVALPVVALPAVASPPVAIALEESVPMPMPRPINLASPKVAPHADDARVTQGPQPVAPDAAPADRPSFFDRLFRPTSPAGTALAYAAPDDGGLGRPDVLGRSLPYDRWTAVYVIATHTVYLPDGTKLEAHSGLGASHDNPSSVAERMRGVTPPNVYDLQPREAPFHGVRALRLNPVDGNAVYGRAGLLAHTYMLGPRGDSNGCVVFKNYTAFLNAYETGSIRRLAVVARLD